MIYSPKTIWLRVLKFCSGPKAEKYLYGLTYCESIFFPIPTDIMLVPMCLARPDKGIYFAWMMSIFSVLGGITAYAIGYFLFTKLQPFWHTWFGGPEQIESVRDLLIQWGFLFGFLGAWTPLPFKIFALTAGFFHANLPIFVLSSLAGRIGRYGLIAWLLGRFGKKVEPFLLTNMNRVGWFAILLVIVYFLYQL